MFDDENGEFTCLANEGASVVDYMLSSSFVFKFVNFFKVDNCIFSVHCPLVCTLSFRQIDLCTENTSSINSNEYTRLYWNAEDTERFDHTFSELIRSFYEQLSTSTAVEMLPCFQNVFKTSCMSTNQPHCNNSHRSLQPSWWNDDCARAKYNKYKCLRRFRTTNQSSDLNLFQKARN